MNTVGSWGRYPNYPQQSHNAHWQSEIATLASTLKAGFLPFGNGRSYGDSCLAQNDQVLCTRKLNRLINVDWEQGIIRAEAGLLLAELLQHSVERGWFLPVTPGTKFVTLAGAVANDVHGKNHHVAGTFGRYVRKFGLWRSDQGLIECSVDQNHELFNASISGLGLTGVILWVELQLKPVKTSLIEVTNIKFGNLDEFFQLSAELDDLNEYSVAWIDCLSSGQQLGRGIYTVGNHAKQGPLKASKDKKLHFPVELPFSLVNSLTVKPFNTLYYHRQSTKTQQKNTEYNPFFYPLDAIHSWNRIYGSSGFQQYQCVLPEAVSQDALSEMLTEIARQKMGSFLVVLKRCGNIASPGLISFPMQGVSLALDFQQVPGKLDTLFLHLDAIVSKAQGRLYPAKDAHMSANLFKQGYPRWQQLEQLRDPSLMSHFWNRVTT